MGAFKFRLAAYHKLKQYEEKSSWNEVLKQEGLVSNLTQQIDTIKTTVAELREKLSQIGVPGGTKIIDAETLNESIHAFLVRTERIRREKVAEEKTLEVLKQKYFEKKKEAKIIDNLKDRKMAEHKKVEAKKDDKKTDDIVSMLIQRRTKGQ
jgi:flagellar export protein FliJ